MSKRHSKRKRQPESAPSPPTRRFLLDEDVPDAVMRFLAERGHEVILVRDQLARGADDQGPDDRTVADYADSIEATLVTFNVRHFEPLIYRYPAERKKRHPNYDPSRGRRFAGALYMSGDRPQALSRLEQCIDLVEFEFARRLRRSDTRVIMWLALQDVKIEG